MRWAATTARRSRCRRARVPRGNRCARDRSRPRSSAQGRAREAAVAGGARLALQRGERSRRDARATGDALRKKKDSSMRVAINLVKDGVAQACVSAGNTGALMAISRFVLKTLPGIDRPAIAAQLPTRKGVDDGARPRRQRQLLAGAARPVRRDGRRARRRRRRHRAADGRPPERRRGRDQGQRLVKETGELLRRRASISTATSRATTSTRARPTSSSATASSATSTLKTSEGLATMLYEFLKAEFTRNALRGSQLLAYPVLRRSSGGSIRAATTAQR